ncbi:hypothetical protein LVJ94_04225 [Pendulispora rubella]|uniref:Uncharacterized protein n=1 Tax=Pendulispora rubella TaxID=2741070 RepID=A0ABZ2LA45_9BACT
MMTSEINDASNSAPRVSVPSNVRRTPRTIVVLGALSILPSPDATAATQIEPHDARGMVAADWTTSGVQVEMSPGEAERRNAEVFSSKDAVLEVKKISGLSWEQLASLFKVDRRSVHLWASGRQMNGQNRTILFRVLTTLRTINRGTPSATRTWLETPSSENVIPLDLLRNGKFDDVAFSPPSATAPRAAPRLSKEAREARAPLPPHVLVEALQDSIHIEQGRLLSAIPLKVSKTK